MKEVVVKNNNLTLLFFLPAIIISKTGVTDFSASQLIYGKPKTHRLLEFPLKCSILASIVV